MAATVHRVSDALALLRALPEFRHAQLAGEPLPLSGGFWAAISMLRLTGVAPPHDELVLRVMPDEALALKETLFQRYVFAQGFATPGMVLSGGPEAGLGGAFVIMERARGEPPLASLGGAAAIRRLPKLVARLPNLLADVTASLHRLSAEPLRVAIREEGLSTPTELPEYLSVLRGWAEQAPRPDLVAAATWLSDHQPEVRAAVICHGDLHPFNILVDDARWTLLDWTAALIAEPGYDLAFTALLLRHPPLAAPAALRPALAAVSGGLARRFLAAYRNTGLPFPSSEDVHWYTCLHGLRILLEVDAWGPAESQTSRPGHPWNTVGPVAAKMLSRACGAEVSFRASAA